MIRVNTIYPAIQGEGSLVGTPMILLRLQGCKGVCGFCDTKETWSYSAGREVSESALVLEILRLRRGEQWVLITGGEPFEQDLTVLTTLLKAEGFLLAVETSGTAPFSGVVDHVCVSPKGIVLDDWFEMAHEFKFVVTSANSLKSIQDHVARLAPTTQIFIQPEWNRRESVLDLCVGWASSFGWRLSMQCHKFLNLP